MSASRFRYRLWDKRTEKGGWLGTMSGIRLAANGELYSSGMNVTEWYDICFSTGLTDKSGVEIFEGDILLEDCPRGNKCVVEWDDLHASFHASYDEKHHTVIGNIYEHKHLLDPRTKGGEGK